jgi:hypothetical protein
MQTVAQNDQLNIEVKRLRKKIFLLPVIIVANAVQNAINELG